MKSICKLFLGLSLIIFTCSVYAETDENGVEVSLTQNILIENEAEKTASERLATGGSPVWRSVSIENSELPSANAMVGEPYGGSANSNFGTDNLLAQMYHPIAFQPIRTTGTYLYYGTGMYCSAGTSAEQVAYAPVHLPTGAKPEGLVAILSDGSASTNIDLSFRRVCNGFNSFIFPNTDLTETTMASLTTSGDPGTRTYYSANVPGTDTHHVNNLNCSYFIRANLNNCASSTELSRVALTYRRDMLTAPTTAPFADVPTSHSFARHINALKSSGITSGCGDGTNYCPNDPVTRGQMAVFLAKAMGLGWRDSNGITLISP